MTFERLDSEKVINYLKDISQTTKNINVRMRLDEIANGRAKPMFGFKNEYGELYLVVADRAYLPHWCGDESDWGYASSFEEDAYMHSQIGAIKNDNTFKY